MIIYIYIIVCHTDPSGFIHLSNLSKPTPKWRIRCHALLYSLVASPQAPKVTNVFWLMKLGLVFSNVQQKCRFYKQEEGFDQQKQEVNQVKDFNQEGFYLQPLTSIGNYINSKKRGVKEHITEDAMNKNIGFFRTNRGLPTKQVRICHNMTWHSLISTISYSKPGNCNLLDFQLLCWFSNMSCLAKSRFKMCLNQKNLCNSATNRKLNQQEQRYVAPINVTLMGWTTHQFKTTGCRRKKHGNMRAWGPLLYL